jgi:hypothetical protein
VRQSVPGRLRGTRAHCLKIAFRSREDNARLDWNPATATTLVGMGRTPADDFRAMRTAIGAEERKLLSEVLREALPPDMADLLRQFDQPTKGGCDTDNLDEGANKSGD